MPQCKTCRAFRHINNNDTGRCEVLYRLHNPTPYSDVMCEGVVRHETSDSCDEYQEAFIGSAHTASSARR